MTQLVTIIGGSGFVGRYVARRMAKAGWRVRVAVRRPNEALFVKPYGAVGQVEPVFCNIRDEASVRSVVAGADAVVNCVGILSASGKNNFGSVHKDGAARVARIASELGVSKFVQISAIGANPNANSEYCRSKAEGEAAVGEAFPTAIILRPSIVFGPEDGFFNKFGRMAERAPILPLVGAETRFQPVYVDDVALAAEVAVTGAVAPGVYELGGPDVMTFRELMQDMLKIVQRRRLVVGLPFWVGALIGGLLDLVQALSMGLVRNNTLTRDQVRSLATDNVVAPGARGLEALGIRPTPMDAVLPEYLWRFRPSGQYAAIKASAKNLRKI